MNQDVPAKGQDLVLAVMGEDVKGNEIYMTIENPTAAVEDTVMGFTKDESKAFLIYERHDESSDHANAYLEKFHRLNPDFMVSFLWLGMHDFIVIDDIIDDMVEL